MEEPTALALLAGILALMTKELIGYLRTKKSNGNPGNPRPAPPVDLSGIEGKLDKLIVAVDGVAENQTKTNRALDDLAHSGDKTRQALADQQEILEWLRKQERLRE